jgi:hypothetical protein
MANTYTLISSNTLSSSAASVTFSSIPSTYTDLVLRGSIRDTTAGTVRDLFIRANNDSSTLYSFRDIEASGSAVASSANTLRSYFQSVNGSNGSGSTSNTFTSFELYIPSYTASQNKPASLISAMENNATAAYITVSAQLYRSTTAISRLDILGDSTIASGSSFYLYGIKNS